MVDNHDAILPQQPDELTRQEEVAMEQGIYNGTMADAAHTGSWPEAERPAPRPRTPHYSHRGGRSYPERGGRDQGLEIDNAAQGPLPAGEEHAYLDEGGPMTREEALAFADRARRKREIDRLHEAAGREGINPAAILKARNERRTQGG